MHILQFIILADYMGLGVINCDEHLCVCSHISETTRLNFTLLTSDWSSSGFVSGVWIAHACTHAHTHTHTHNRFMALWILFRTNRVRCYQKKHSPTYTYLGHQSSLMGSITVEINYDQIAKTSCLFWYSTACS